MPVSKIEDAIEDIRAGKMVIIVDDEDRETEPGAIDPGPRASRSSPPPATSRGRASGLPPGPPPGSGTHAQRIGRILRGLPRNW